MVVEFRDRENFWSLYRRPLQKQYEMIFDKLSWILFILAQSTNKIKFTESEISIFVCNVHSDDDGDDDDRSMPTNAKQFPMK